MNIWQLTLLERFTYDYYMYIYIIVHTPMDNHYLSTGYANKYNTVKEYIISDIIYNLYTYNKMTD